MESTFGVGHCTASAWLLAVEPSTTRVLGSLTEALAAATTLVLIVVLVVSPLLSAVILEARAGSKLTPLLSTSLLLATLLDTLLLTVPRRRLLGRLDRRLSRWGEVVPALGPFAHRALALFKKKELLADHLVW